MTTPAPNRNPLTETLNRVGPGLAALVAVVNGLGATGLMSTAQTTAITDYAGEVAAAAAPTGPIAIAAGVIIGLVSGGATLLGVRHAGSTATAQTTPVTSPRDVDGVSLVRVDGLPLGGNPAGQLDAATATFRAATSGDAGYTDGPYTG